LSLYVLILFVGALVSGAVALIAWQRPATATGRALARLMTAIFVWSVAATFHAAAYSMGAKVLFSKLQYLGVVSSPVLMFLFALEFSRIGHRVRAVGRLALWVVPATTFLLVATNEAHRLIWSGLSWAPGAEGRVLIYEFGAFFWVHAGYSYLLFVAASILFVRSFTRFKDIQRQQALTLLLALPWPWAANLLFISGQHGPFTGQDYTPLGFVIAGIFLLWGIFRLQLVDLLPVARRKVIESMGESLIVLDEAGTIAAMNPAARRLLAGLGGPGETARDTEIIGHPAVEIFSVWPEMAAVIAAPIDGLVEIAWMRGDQPVRIFNIHLSPLGGDRPRVKGWVAVLYDITPVKEAEAQAVEARRVAEALHQTGVALSQTLDPKQMSSLILELLGRIIPFDIGVFLTAQGADLRLDGLRGFPDGQPLLGRSFSVAGCRLCNNAVLRKRPLISAITSPEDILLPIPPGAVIRSYMGIPLVFQEHIQGLLALYDSRPNYFTERDIRIAEPFANQVAISLENSRLFEELSRRAITDNLTGLLNRRAFSEAAEREFERARRYRRPLSLILFDIDKFKSVNDAHGHLIGDQVLRVLSDTVRKTTRATDSVCRWGGEEFLILMPEQGHDQAVATAERLRQDASNLVVVTPSGHLSLTISLGVASLKRQEDETLDSLIGRADAAMYEAKAAGRNTVRG
jgi:diguanylate cyclase (GGDEF)-like protein